MTVECTHENCTRTFETERAQKIHASKSHNDEKPWTDEARLRELYHGEGMTSEEIAEGWDITPSGILKWMDELGIEKRGPSFNGKHTEMPWQNEYTLRQAHHQDERTPKEIADDMGCSAGTIKTWLRRHGIENRTDSIKRRRRMWADPEELQRLYHEEGMSLSEVGQELGVDREAIRTEMQRHGIPRRGRLEAVKNSFATFGTGIDGYEYWKDSSEGGGFLRVHQLLAISKGSEPHRVFSGEYDVHHRNGVKWDNRLENVELLTKAEHNQAHADG